MRRSNSTACLWFATTFCPRHRCGSAHPARRSGSRRRSPACPLPDGASLVLDLVLEIRSGAAVAFRHRRFSVSLQGGRRHVRQVRAATTATRMREARRFDLVRPTRRDRTFPSASEYVTPLTLSTTLGASTSSSFSECRCSHSKSRFQPCPVAPAR